MSSPLFQHHLKSHSAGILRSELQVVHSRVHSARRGLQAVVQVVDLMDPRTAAARHRLDVEVAEPIWTAGTC